MTHRTFKYVRHLWMESTADKLENLKVVNSGVMDERNVCVWNVELSRNIFCLALKKLQFSYWESEAMKHTRLIWVTHCSRELLCNNYSFQYLANNSCTKRLRSPFSVWTRQMKLLFYPKVSEWQAKGMFAAIMIPNYIFLTVVSLAGFRQTLPCAKSEYSSWFTSWLSTDAYSNTHQSESLRVTRLISHSHLRTAVPRGCVDRGPSDGLLQWPLLSQSTHIGQVS